MIFYTDKFVLKGHAGTTRGPFIFIRPEYKDDKGLLEHELVHRKQWLRTLGLHAFFYLLSKKYRFKSEVEAYKEQLKHYKTDKRRLFATLLVEKYDLDITFDEALIALSADV
jgi:hypothetical protein